MSNEELLVEALVEEPAVEQLTIEQPKVGPKKKQKIKGNLIADVAAKVEKLTRTTARKLADELAENIEANYFELGGALLIIQENGWFDGYDSFQTYVFEEFGFKKTKTNYLMAVHSNLVTKQIPWEKVSHLGWTKMKALAPVLTLENLDDWVAKAEGVTVLELLAMLKPKVEGVDTATSSEFVTLRFPFKPDQVETMRAALGKAKTEFNTASDEVAFEKISAAYLADGEDPFKAALKAAGWEAVINAFDTVFPEIALAVTLPDGYEVQEQPAAEPAEQATP